MPAQLPSASVVAITDVTVIDVARGDRKNVRSIQAVIANGRVFDRVALNQLLTRSAVPQR